MGINQVLSLVCWSKAKEGRTPLFNANNLLGKDPAVGINGLEGVGHEWLLPKRSPCYVLEESRIWRGRKGNRPTSACPLYYLSFLLNFLSFLFYFLSYLFSFLLLCFLFTSWMLCFSILFSGHGKGPFIVPAVTNVLPLCPLIAFVWSRRICRPPSLCDIHPCQTKASLFRSSVYRSTSFLPWYKCFLSLSLKACTQRFSPQTCLFWVVCHPSRTYLPKGLGQKTQNRSFPLSPPPNHTPFTSYLWLMAPPCPILAGYRLVVPGPRACFLFRYVQESACYSCVCRDLEILRLCFLTFYVGFSLISRSIQELGFVWWWALHFFGPFLIFFISCNVELLFLP